MVADFCEYAWRVLLEHTVVAPPQVMEPHPNPQDYLLQVAHRTRLGVPELFQRLMALPVLALVRVIDPLEEQPGRVLITRAGMQRADKRMICDTHCGKCGTGRGSCELARLGVNCGCTTTGYGGVLACQSTRARLSP